MRPAVRPQLTGNRGRAHVTNGSTTVTYGKIQLRGQLRHWKYKHTFLVADIEANVLIGMDFLQVQQASICFKTGSLKIGNDVLV